MGKSKKGGHRKRGTVITPKRIAKAAVVLDGAKRIWDADLKGYVSYIAANPRSLATPGPYTAALTRFGPGVAEIVLGPKAIDATAKFLSKGEPMIGKLVNTKLVKIGA